MTENIRDDAARTLAGQAGYLIRQAARAPSLHNTQPWRFKVSQDALELYADTERQLRVDPDGREMLISCGAALYGLRLAIRSLGRVPEVELLPDTAAAAGRRPLAQVRLGPAAPVTAAERPILKAVPHRHTHRGSFDSGPLPAGLLARLQDDARAEGATLIVIDSERARGELAAIVAASDRRQDRDPESRAETCAWTRDASSLARDGVPANAFPGVPRREAGQLPQRDFDLGRSFGLLTAGGPAALVTAVLVTPGDGEKDWLHAGQALNRLLLRAASQWVFADLNTQPLEDVATRTQIKDGLALPGSPQMLLALGISRTTRPTARRPAAELTGP